MVTPSNQLDIEEPSETTVLELAFQSINMEIDRIKQLLKLKKEDTPNSKLSEFIEKLNKSFLEEMN